MSDWAIGGLYLLGVLHAVPAWYFGKAAGIAYMIRKNRASPSNIWISKTGNMPTTIDDIRFALEGGK